jgi:Na+/proline symporter
MAENRLDEIRGKALARVEKSERNLKLGVIGFAILDTAFFVAFLLIMDFSDKVHLLIFMASSGFYLLLLLGLIVLGLQVKRDTQLVLRAIELLEERIEESRK